MKRTRPASLSRLLSPANRVVFVALATLVLATIVDVGCSPSRERLVRRGRPANAPKPAQVASQPESRRDGEASSATTNRQRRSSTARPQSRSAGWGSVLNVRTSTSLETRATRNRRSAEQRDQLARVAVVSAAAEDNEPVDAVAANEAVDETGDEAVEAKIDDESEEALVDADEDAAGISTADSTDLEVVDLEADNLETDEDAADDDADADEEDVALEDDDEMDEEAAEAPEDEDDDQAAGEDGENENTIAEGGVEETAAERATEASAEAEEVDEDAKPFDVLKRAVGLGTSDSDDNDDNDADKKNKDTESKDAVTKDPGTEKPPVEKPSTSTSKGAPTDSRAKPKPEADARNGKKPSYAEIFEKTRAAERERRGKAAKLLEEAKTLLDHRDYDRARRTALKAKQLDPSRDAEVEKLIQSIIRAEARASRPRASRSR